MDCRSVYVLVAIVRKRLKLEAPLYTLLQVISVMVFEKIEIRTAFSQSTDRCDTAQGKRGKTVGSLAFFPCADSAPWILCVMCRRRPPFPP